MVTILQSLTQKLEFGDPPISNLINVMRDSVLQSALRAFGRARFDPQKTVNVVFVDSENVGEGAVDMGGPQREFFRLLIQELRDSQYFCGPEEAKNINLVSQGMRSS